jgi:hypothetical protein
MDVLSHCTVISEEITVTFANDVRAMEVNGLLKPTLWPRYFRYCITVVDVTAQWAFDQSRYQSRHSELATLADVFTFRPHNICFTAPSILAIVSTQFSVNVRVRLTSFRLL